MELKLSDTLVKQIDTHDPFMQIHKIGQKYNDLVDRYNALEAELDKLKNPPADEEQPTEDTPADETGEESDTNESDAPDADETADEEKDADGSDETADEKSEDEE